MLCFPIWRIQPTYTPHISHMSEQLQINALTYGYMFRTYTFVRTCIHCSTSSNFLQTKKFLSRQRGTLLYPELIGSEICCSRLFLLSLDLQSFKHCLEKTVITLPFYTHNAFEHTGFRFHGLFLCIKASSIGIFQIVPHNFLFLYELILFKGFKPHFVVVEQI